MPIWTVATIRLLPKTCPVCPRQSDWVMLRWNTNDATEDIAGRAECRHFYEQYDQEPIWPYMMKEVKVSEIDDFKAKWYGVTKTILPGV